jgi:hypothetical protein
VGIKTAPRYNTENERLHELSYRHKHRPWRKNELKVWFIYRIFICFSLIITDNYNAQIRSTPSFLFSNLFLSWLKYKHNHTFIHELPVYFDKNTSVLCDKSQSVPKVTKLRSQKINNYSFLEWVSMPVNYGLARLACLIH